nr:hypothetical protein [uncultured Paludibaculum sp.]
MKEPRALAHHVAIDLVQRLDLIRREAVLALGARRVAGQVVRGLELAAPRTGDEPVLQPIFGVALLIVDTSTLVVLSL